MDVLDDELRELRLAEVRLKEAARRWTQEELERGLTADDHRRRFGKALGREA